MTLDRILPHRIGYRPGLVFLIIGVGQRRIIGGRINVRRRTHFGCIGAAACRLLLIRTPATAKTNGQNHQNRKYTRLFHMLLLNMGKKTMPSTP